MKAATKAQKPVSHQKSADKPRAKAIKGKAEGQDIKAKPQKQVSTVGNPNIAEAGKATQFKAGVSPNPGGKPIGARNRLQGDFMRELSEDFAEHGRAAIQDCRTTKPDVYIKVVASLMPKELEIKRPLEDLTDDELDNAVALLRERLGAAACSRKGSGTAKVGEQAGAVRTLQ